MVDSLRFTQKSAGNLALVLLCLILPALVTNCACLPTKQVEREVIYSAPQPTPAGRPHAPAFLIKEPEQQYNRIGMPSVRESAQQQAEIYIDPKKPAIFFETQEFTTARGRYRNLVYRIHFQQVPFGLGKFNLTAGKNPGLLLIYTVDVKGQLLLVTTVHTCGCFLAFFPTTALPAESFPSCWPIKSQRVYGYTLPSLLHTSMARDSQRIVFTLESESHRISDVFLSDQGSLHNSHDTVDMDLFPMNTLYQLPFKDTTESFFELDGPRKGYVKNNTKILERLLMSWWAFDLHVGEDKSYGEADTSGTIFYTSLKFWNRKASDLKNFPRFLSYWGWKL